MLHFEINYIRDNINNKMQRIEYSTIPIRKKTKTNGHALLKIKMAKS